MEWWQIAVATLLFVLIADAVIVVAEAAVYAVMMTRFVATGLEHESIAEWLDTYVSFPVKRFLARFRSETEACAAINERAAWLGGLTIIRADDYGSRDVFEDEVVLANEAAKCDGVMRRFACRWLAIVAWPTWMVAGVMLGMTPLHGDSGSRDPLSVGLQYAYGFCLMLYLRARIERNA